MTEDILINITPFETRVACVEQGSVQELHMERRIERGFVGNLYLGKVLRVLPGMQSAFVDIGLKRSAFIHVNNLYQNRMEYGTSASASATPIEKLLFEGQSLLVEVLKDPLGSKGARLTTQLSLAGRLLVYLPQDGQDTHIGISQKIAEPARLALRERVLQLSKGHNSDGATGGYIVRTQAETATDEELAADIAYLHTLWSHVQARARSVAAPALLHEDLTLAQRVLRDMARPCTRSIIVDSRSAARALTEWASLYTPALAERIQHYSGEQPLFDTANVDAAIQAALSRRVDLKSGGYLIVDQTEALTTIDVNTGGFVGGRNFDQTIFKTNLEAAQAIARQLRLRNLGGIIIIDFIDMQDEAHRQAVLDELNKALGRDRMRVAVNGFSRLGLVEMTRKRTRDSLAHQLCETCPTCQARGHVKTPRTVCYEILREILREARQFNPREFRIIASPAVIDLFLEEESQHLALLGDFVDKPISLTAESSYTQEQYDIVLG